MTRSDQSQPEACCGRIHNKPQAETGGWGSSIGSSIGGIVEGEGESVEADFRSTSSGSGRGRWRVRRLTSSGSGMRGGRRLTSGPLPPEVVCEEGGGG